jgi:hypothetical protein
MTTTIHLDRPLIGLDPSDEDDWRDWFTHHGITNYRLIFLPSQLVWNPRTKTLKVQIQFYDGSHMPYTEFQRIKIPGGLLPFPGGYRVEESER